MNISFKAIGNFAKTLEYLAKISGLDMYVRLCQYGEKGVRELSAATPVRTGKTAASWNYRVERTKSGYSISWDNSNENEGVPIVILIRYGHVTKTGYHVPPNDFITPIVDKLMAEISEVLWKEVT